VQSQGYITTTKIPNNTQSVADNNNSNDQSVIVIYDVEGTKITYDTVFDELNYENTDDESSYEPNIE
jgi:hypothetical protein